MKNLVYLLVFIISALIPSYLWIAALPEAPLVAEPTPRPTPKSISEAKLEDLVHEWRVENGYTELIHNEYLCAYAKERVEEVKTDWSHDQFMEDKCSKVPFYWCGENLAMGYLDEEFALRAWLNSPTHKENIEKPYKETCIECSDGYCAQIFAHD